MKGLLKKIEVFNKKAVKVMLSLAMLLTIIMPLTSVIAYAEETGTIGDVTWTFEDLDEDGTKETLRFAGRGSIGDYMSGRDHIDAPWEVEGFNNITSIIFEDGITVIGDGAFKGNENLESVTILDQTNKLDINWYAFCDCINITNVSIGNNVFFAGESTFENTGVSRLVLNGNNITTHLKAFAECSKLEEVVINGNNCHLSPSTFAFSYSLKRIVINGENTFIETWSLGECGLEEIVFTNKKQSLLKSSFDLVNSTNLMAFYLMAGGFRGLEDWLEEGLVIPSEAELEKIEEAVFEIVDVIGLPPVEDEVAYPKWQKQYFDKASEYALANTDLPIYVVLNNKAVTVSLPTNWEGDAEADALGIWYGAYLEPGSHIHKFDSSNWKYDGTYHWYECTIDECDYKVCYEEHDGDTCSVCGKTFSPSIIHESANDFDVTSDTPSKTFTQGQTSISTLHIAGLKLNDIHKVGDDYDGVYVTCNGEPLEEGTHYDLAEGSVKVNLKKSYLDKLLVGEHTIKTYIKNGAAASATDKDYEFTAVITIKAKSSPAPAPTPEPSNPGSSPRPGYRAPNTGASGATTMILNNGFIELGTIAAGLTIGFISNKKKKDN